MNHVYPEPGTPSGDVGDEWRIGSFGYFVVATGNGVQIKSRATDGQPDWQGSGAPSSESRLNAVYPLPENAAGDLDFVWRVESSGFFVVGTGNRVQIKSRITDGP